MGMRMLANDEIDLLPFATLWLAVIIGVGRKTLGVVALKVQYAA
jgi:hypothetical protein